MPASFPPLIGDQPKVLILGSMPGIKSLQEQQYYAHPRNAFWHIMGELFGAGFNLPYNQRLEILKQHHIALWDVLGYCEREGSLDSSIESGSEVPNAIPELLQEHHGIRRVLLNGGKAASAFRKHILPSLPATHDYRIVQMPSTSPAHARMSQAEKLAVWREALLK
ncbi:DNA-deoxyinosine glycosylase [Solemya elarraichensis gill symbiont]|uniref:DNA-deoxyinosine glycosylase n=1 Tax=Solemya elarraichensis gill symbiont TaxID=1918949 RepID=A0A1T2L7Z9_9GAMM|nr:DNA-deoxyinosine glycosylase [Solemya elarraichensis gill symbiont]OOZ41154.1 DNA-deoxyinosine glycosylase [Solemya elarraichensis gill symbiont]